MCRVYIEEGGGKNDAGNWHTTELPDSGTREAFKAY